VDWHFAFDSLFDDEAPLICLRLLAALLEEKESSELPVWLADEEPRED
jgi:hypothetical protein